MGTTRYQLALFGTGDRLYRSDDHGKTWTEAGKLPRNSFTNIYFADPQHGWVVGDYGKYAMTTDGGTTWTEPAVPATSKLQNVYFVTPKNGWMVASSHAGGPLASDDGGATWAFQAAGVEQNRTRGEKKERNQGRARDTPIESMS